VRLTQIDHPRELIIRARVRGTRRHEERDQARKRKLVDHKGVDESSRRHQSAPDIWSAETHAHGRLQRRARSSRRELHTKIEREGTHFPLTEV
jgi:hypothetical protein